MNIDNIPLFVWHGMKARDWYSDCGRALVDLFGDNAKLAAQCLAATSMNNYMKGNVTMARKALYQIKNNLPFSGYMPNVISALHLAKEGKDFPGRKTNNFWRAMVGDPDAVVVDIWILRAFGYKSTSATKRQYDSIESWIRAEARRRNIEPRQLQAMIWIGIRTITNGPDEDDYIIMLNRKMKNLFNII